MRLWLVVALFWPATLLAQSPFDGTWVAKSESVRFPRKPEVYLLQDGSYTCTTCVPRIAVKADGKDHPLAGSPYFSTISVQVFDEGRIRITEKLSGRTVYAETDMVSPDGGTLVETITDSAAPNGEPVTAMETFSRVKPGPSGSGPVSGSWQPEKLTGTSQSGLTVTYHSTPDGLRASTPSGEGYDARFDGKDYPIQGDPVRETVSLRRINARTIAETDKEEGAVHYRLRMEVSPDGKTMQVTELDHERGTRTTYTMEKRSD